MNQDTKDILVLMGKAIGGGAVIGLGSAIIFKGSLLGLAVAGIGGLAWGSFVAKKYTNKQAMLATQSWVDSATTAGFTQQQILGFEENPIEKAMKAAVELITGPAGEVVTIQ